MELFETIESRRSVRVFNNKKVSKDVINKIIEAAIRAPSSCDVQGWKFIVIDDKNIMEKLVDLDTAVFVKRAPVSILVLYKNTTDNLEYMDHIQSAAAAIQNMLLAARSMGLGTCWVCHLPRKQELRKFFNIPNTYDPVAIIPVGYYDKEPKERLRRHDARYLTSYNTFNFKKEKEKGIGLLIKRVARKIYYYIPFRKFFRKKINKKFERRFESDDTYED